MDIYVLNSCIIKNIINSKCVFISFLVMSRTFTLTGTSNVLTSSYFPPIELDQNYSYGLGLVGFYSYNSIPNVHEGNNKFYYHDSNNEKQVITLPPGAYEITEINNYIQSKLGVDNFLLRPNNNTLNSEIISKYSIDFTEKDSLGHLLGFSKKLTANTLQSSDRTVNIVKVINIRVECNITGGAYYDNESVHTIFEFDVDVEPGYRLTKEPKNIIYLPVIKNSIDNITLRILDQDNDLVDFANEKIVVRLELKQLSELQWE